MRLVRVLVACGATLFVAPNLVANALFAQRGHGFMPCMCCLDVRLPQMPGWLACTIIVLFVVGLIVWGITDTYAQRQLVKQKEVAEVAAAEARKRAEEQWTLAFGRWVGKRVRFSLDGTDTDGVVMGQEADELSINHVSNSGALNRATRKVAEVREI